MTNTERIKRVFTTDGTFPLCHQGLEDFDHIFRKCEEAVKVWRGLQTNRQGTMNERMSIDVWLPKNISQIRHNGPNVEWRIIFANTIWWLWKWRNELVFKNKKTHTGMKVRLIIEHSYEIKRAFNSMSIMDRNIMQYTCRMIRLLPPLTSGWIALNVDGCLKQNNTKDGGGGVLRTEEGKWVSGFTRNIGCCSVEEAELWAICDGLEFTWMLRHKRVRLEVDS